MLIVWHHPNVLRFHSFFKIIFLSILQMVQFLLICLQAHWPTFFSAIFYLLLNIISEFCISKFYTFKYNFQFLLFSNIHFSAEILHLFSIIIFILLSISTITDLKFLPSNIWVISRNVSNIYFCFWLSDTFSCFFFMFRNCWLHTVHCGLYKVDCGFWSLPLNSPDVGLADN